MKHYIILVALVFILDVNAQCAQTISAGAGKSVVIQDDGKIWAWGIDSNFPVVSGSDNDWVTLPEGWNYPHTYSMLVKANGTLWLRQNGSNPQVQIGTQNNWNKIAQGATFNLATKINGTLWSWGSNMYGELGNGTTAASTTPAQIGDSSWIWITAGFHHVAGIKSDGTLWCWGTNNSGQLGDGTTINRWAPVQVGIENDWESIAAGSGFTIAIKTDGTLWAWGLSYGLGNGTTNNVTLPIQVGSDSDWNVVTAGQLSVGAIKNNGTLWTWGSNFDGMLGQGTGMQDDSFIPIQVGTDTDWEDIDNGAVHVIAKKMDGSLWSWGHNSGGSVGDGTNINRTAPVLIQCPTLDIVQSDLPIAFTIAPNPVLEILTIDTSLDISRIMIFDMTGKNIFSSESNSAILNVGHLSRGIYLLRVEADNQVFQQKFIKV